MQPNSKTTVMKKIFSYTFLSIPTNMSTSIIQEPILPETQDLFASPASLSRSR